MAKTSNLDYQLKKFEYFGYIQLYVYLLHIKCQEH